ncbi:MAG: 2OG-Fe(II) oxygenase family protein [Xanthomonadales bacterium]|nr:2OG-Fe(II) oxygenase family protein [Xanthomonadales bacterium]
MAESPSFHPELDLAALRTALADRTRLQIGPIFPEDDARALAEELASIQAWDVALTTRQGPIRVTHEEYEQMLPAQRARLSEDLRRQARSGFSFAYFRRDVVPGEAPVVPAFANWVQSEAFLDWMRHLTGEPDITRADAHASCYRAGSFLKRHDDTYAGKNRRYAFVFNLSRRWEADWGGLLHFQDEQGNVIETLQPRFNTLSIFKVPQEHFVSQVATYALNPRLSLTGWLFAD